MTSIAARIMDALDPTASSKAAAITGQNAPTPEQLADDSAASAKLFGSGDADTPAVEPIYEPERPVIDDVAEAIVRAVRSAMIGVPIPAGSVTFGVNAPAATCGRPVQIVPASGGRPRRVLIRCGSQPVELYADDRQGVDAVTPATGGYSLPPSGVHETATQGPVYAAGAAAWSVSVWIDHYPAPVVG